MVDLAAMRDAMADMGGEPSKINPLVPAELVIDHSVQVDVFGTRDAFVRNAEKEFERNQERYAFLRWGQGAFEGFKVVPPDTGIVHQVNLEYLARVVFTSDETAHEGPLQAYPDTLVGTDSHTTMVNGLGVLGWGVGGIEAEAAMLGQPMSMLIPQVLGFRLHGELPEGATATDLVLTVTQMLRERGVVGMFVEFFGAGVSALPIADRATIGNMSPEFGSTCAIFPIDAETLRYLEFSGRPPERIELIEAYARDQGLWHDEHSEEPTYSDTLELDLSQVVPSLAGPKRPQDRVSLTEAKASFRVALEDYLPEAVEDPHFGPVDEDTGSADSFPASDPPSSTEPANGDGARDRHAEPLGTGAGTGGAQVAERTQFATPVTLADGTETELDHGHVVIAAITSCTNTSNPSVMLGAGILARNAVQRGLRSKPWVKTSLAPGSKVVTEYLKRAGLDEYLDELGFNLVGYGCTTCIGNSGPLPQEISDVVGAEDLAVVSVLSGNRNFEGRINPDVKMNYLASPPLCVAYALAGTMDVDLFDEPLGRDEHGEDVFLKDIWPSEHEIAETIEEAVQSDMFRKSYAEVYDGDERWNSLEVPTGDRFAWADDSTYVRRPPFFEDLPAEPAPVEEIEDARVLAVLGDSVTTDHISPAGAIKKDSPAGRYLIEHGVEQHGLQLLRIAPRQPRGDDARHVREHPPAQPARWLRRAAGGRVHACAARWGAGADLRRGHDATPSRARRWWCSPAREYGSGSSRDWAAKGTNLLGVRAVIAAVLRAHPPLQPRGDGRAAPAVPRGRVGGVARAHRRGGDLDLRPGGRRRQGGHGHGRREGVHGARADRHPEGGRVLQARRDPAVRAAPVARDRLRFVPGRGAFHGVPSRCRVAPRSDPAWSSACSGHWRWPTPDGRLPWGAASAAPYSQFS